MLAPLDPALLERVAIPARRADEGGDPQRGSAPPASSVAERRESQEACFLAGDDYRAFLERQGLEPAEGAIVDEDGIELGRHEGVWRYTPGQRRGIGVAAAEPLYALRSDAATNTLVVGPRGSLACSAVEVRGALYAPAGDVEAKLRYRSPALPARVTETATGFTLELAEPAYGVAPGQIAVLYDDDAVVGCGVVSSATRN